MNYSMEKISTVAACNTLLASAQKKKQNLERKRRDLGESIDSFRERLDNIDKESVVVQLVLDAYTTAYNTMPTGTKDKMRMSVAVKRQELRKAQLEKKAFTCNLRALLSKELRYNKLDSQVAAIEQYITVLQQRKTALGNAALRIIHTAASSRPPVVRRESRYEKRSYKAQTRFPNLRAMLQDHTNSTPSNLRINKREHLPQMLPLYKR